MHAAARINYTYMNHMGKFHVCQSRRRNHTQMSISVDYLCPPPQCLYVENLVCDAMVLGNEALES